MSMPALFKGRLSDTRDRVAAVHHLRARSGDRPVQGRRGRIVSGAERAAGRAARRVDRRITEELAAYDKAHPERPSAPFAVNQIVHKSNNRLDHDLAVCEKYKVPMLITSLGAREELNKAAHDWGGIVFHDVINQKFAHKAVEKGADGLVLVAAGAGGHAGTISPLAFRRGDALWFDGPIALSGAIANGRAIRAARILGADFAYIGSAFIATEEANAVEGYKQMITSSSAEGHRLFEPVHRRARQLPQAVDRQGRSQSRRAADLRSLQDELWHRCLRRAQQAEGVEGNLGLGQGIGGIGKVCRPLN
jgi:nitronate monooxygenase